VRVVGWWALVALGLLAAYYAVTLALVGGFVLLGDRLPLAIGLGALILIPAAGLGVVVIERLQGRDER
jgi:hypothetical protein